MTVQYRTNADGSIGLYLDGEQVRVAVRPISPKRVVPFLTRELNNALRVGAAHGRCNRQRELADMLLGRETPGHVIYIPPLRAFSRVAEFARELRNAFQIGGEHPVADVD